MTRERHWAGLSNVKIKRAALALAAIPIVIAAWNCLAWHDLTVERLVACDDGRAFGIVAVKGSPRFREVRAWSADLAEQRGLFAQQQNVDAIAVAPSGARLLVGGYGRFGRSPWDGLALVDTETGRELWTASRDHDGMFQLPFAFVCEGEYVVAAKWNNVESAFHMRVYQVRSGALIGELPNEDPLIAFFNIKSRGSRLAYLTEMKELVVVDLTDGQIQEIARVPGVEGFEFREDGSIVFQRRDDTSVIGADGTTIFTAPESPEMPADLESERRPIWSVSLNHRHDLLVSKNRQTQATRTRNLQTFRQRDMLFMLWGVSFAFALWVDLLIRDGARSHRPRRALSDAAIVFVLLPCMWWATEMCFLNLAIFWCGAGCSCVFFGVLGMPNTKPGWWLILGGILLLPLAPVVLAALLLRQFRWRCRRVETAANQQTSLDAAEPKAPKRQYAIRDLILATAAVAAILGWVRMIASKALPEVVAIPAPLALGLTLLALSTRVIEKAARILLAVSSCMIAFTSVGISIVSTEMGPFLFASILVFVFALLRNYGYMPQRIPISQPA